MAADDRLRDLEVEVAVELEIARSGQADGAACTSPAEWAFDPTEIERDQIGLGMLLGAVQALECDPAAEPTAELD
jgi:hypothetical protein